MNICDDPVREAGLRQGPDICAFIVDFGNPKNTKVAVDSVLSGTSRSVEILVLVNGGLVESFNSLHESYKDNKSVRLYLCMENSGYTGGINQLFCEVIATRERPSAVLFLNNDAWLEAGSLDRLYAALGENERIAIVGPRIRSPRGRLLEDGLFLIPYIFHHCSYNRCPGFRRRNESPYEVRIVSGTCMLVKWEYFAFSKGFDNRFFAYFEDWDLCLTAYAKGWRCVHVPGAVSWHIGALSSGANSRVRQFLLTRNRYLLAAKHAGVFSFALVFVPAFVMSRVVYKLLLLLVTGKIEGASGIAHAIMWLLSPESLKAKWWPIANTDIRAVSDVEKIRAGLEGTPR